MIENIDESWKEPLKKWFDSNECKKIHEDLYKKGWVLPEEQYLYRAFKETKLDSLKVLWLGLSPYPNPGCADGLAFSCSRTKSEQASLKLLFNSLEDDLKCKDDRNPDLSRWANQGVLLLNSALSTIINEPLSHLKLWRPFMIQLFRILYNKELIIITFGGESKKYRSLFNEKLHTCKYLEHPAYSARQERGLLHQNFFSWSNFMLNKQGKEEIKWFNEESKVEIVNKQYQELI